jgi:hypothetical protein
LNWPRLYQVEKELGKEVEGTLSVSVMVILIVNKIGLRNTSAITRVHHWVCWWGHLRRGLTKGGSPVLKVSGTIPQAWGYYAKKGVCVGGEGLCFLVPWCVLLCSSVPYLLWWTETLETMRTNWFSPALSCFCQVFCHRDGILTNTIKTTCHVWTDLILSTWLERRLDVGHWGRNVGSVDFRCLRRGQCTSRRLLLTLSVVGSFCGLACIAGWLVWPWNC